VTLSISFISSANSSDDDNVHILSRPIHRKNLRIRAVFEEDRIYPLCEEMPINTEDGLNGQRMQIRMSGQAIADGKSYGSSAILAARLIKDVGQVVSDCFLTQPQLFCNFPVGDPLRRQA
jgi:hypothetical protein